MSLIGKGQSADATAGLRDKFISDKVVGKSESTIEDVMLCYYADNFPEFHCW